MMTAKAISTLLFLLFFFFLAYSLSLAKDKGPDPRQFLIHQQVLGRIQMDTSTYNIHHPELIKEKFAEIIALNVSGNTARRGKKRESCG